MILKKYFLVALMLTLIYSAWAQVPVADLGPSVKVYEQYQSESHQRMNEYERLIDVFYIELSMEEQNVRNRNESKLVELEKRAANLRVRIESFRPREMKDWLKFKFTTTRALNEFDKNISDLKFDFD